MMTPNIKSSWILWYLIVVPTTYLVVNHMFEPTITLGDIIVLFITIPAFAVGVWKTITYVLYRINPFRLEYQAEHQFRGNRPSLKKQTITVGRQELLIRLRPRRVTSFDRFHTRLVKSKNQNSEFPERNEISITNLVIKAEAFQGYTPYPAVIDKTNGMERQVSPPYRCAPEDSIYLCPTITSKMEWEGYILVEGTRSDGHKGRGYLAISVKNKKV